MSREISLVLSGGMALGAYQAGAYARLHEEVSLRPTMLIGASVGAVNAALIAGNAPQDRIAALRGFWDRVTGDFWAPLRAGVPMGLRHAMSWLSAVQVRLFGCTGAFRPRAAELLFSVANSLYDLSPLRPTLLRFIDFDRLNAGECRVRVAATDIETGERIVFDTSSGDRLGPDHLIASASLLPEFPPVSMGGRLLGDGGFSANLPLDDSLIEGAGERICFAVDLFSPAGEAPASLEQASARQWDLMFGNQSRDRIRLLEQELRLRAAEGSDGANGTVDSLAVYLLRYRPAAYEAGPERPFDFSTATLGDRWDGGFADMEKAIQRMKIAREAHGFSVQTIDSRLATAGRVSALENGPERTG